MNNEQKPVAYINVEKRTLEWAKPMRWETPTIATLEPVPLYTHPAPAVVAQLVEAAESALEAMQSVAGEAYQRAEPVCCGRGGNECCGCPEPKWNSVDEVTMIRLHRPQQELTAALAEARGCTTNGEQKLLELAAKAAGVRWIDPCFNYDEFGRMMLDFGDGATEWNPLTIDGDAFRLAVKLAICVNQGNGLVLAERSATINSPECGVIEALSVDPYAATRRVIVRAAAEIGKQMGDE